MSTRGRKKSNRASAAKSATLSLRLPAVVERDLGRLAARTRRTKSFLAAEAVGDYVARELAIVAGVERGLADMRAGRLVTHEEAMAELRTTIAKASRKRA